MLNVNDDCTDYKQSVVCDMYVDIDGTDYTGVYVCMYR